MKTPRELAEEVVEGYRSDELPGHAPGVDLTDRIEVAIADALKEHREACARICDERAKSAAEGFDPLGEYDNIDYARRSARADEAEACAADIRAGGEP